MMFSNSISRRRLALGAVPILLANVACPIVNAQQSTLPRFVDERRLPLTAAEAEAKRKAEEQAKEEQRRQAAEAAAKQQAEEERRFAAEAEAKRKAQEEERRLAAEADAKRKAQEEERRIAAESEAKRKAQEEERRLAAEADAKRKAQEEERRIAAEAEAKRKAQELAQAKAQEEERRIAAEAEAKRKAQELAEAQAKEEERRLAAEAEAKRKAQELAQAQAKEEERRLAAEAEAKRKAQELAQAQAQEEERRLAAEAETKRKAQETARSLQAAAATAPVAAGTGAAPARTTADCANERVAAQALPGGRFKIDIEAPCRAGQSFSVQYGQFVFERQLDAAGRGSAIVDLFQGKEPPLSLLFPDGKRQSVSPEAVDLRGLSKVAVAWRAPVNLDLHAYEYATLPGGKGHVWVRAPSSAEAALAEMQSSKRGRGFMSSADDGRGPGDKVEVYTFWHHDEQQSGLVATALDYESRGNQPQGEVCGTGPQAAVAFETIVLTPRGRISRERGSIAAAPCGIQLTGTSRFMEDAVPDISAKP